MRGAPHRFGLFLAMLASAAALGLACRREPAPRVGDPAPPLILERLAAAPVERIRSWDEPALAGKPVVLEFWATWCGPCIEAFPHWNRLHERFGDRIVFLSVTDEPEAEVRRFLDENPVAGWHGFDEGEALFGAWGIWRRPTTFLIGADRRIAAVAHPKGVDAAALENLAAARPIAPEEVELTDRRRVAAFFEGEVGDAEPLLLLSVTPHDPAARPEHAAAATFRRTDLSVRELVAWAWDAHPTRVKFTVPENSEKYDLLVHLPGASPAELHATARLALAATFGVAVAETRRKVDGYRLVSTGAAGPKLSRSAPEDQTISSPMGPASRGYWAKNRPLSSLAWLLETYFVGKPVVDHSGRPGGHSFRLDWGTDRSEAALRRALREQLGLDLVPARIEIGVVVVSEGKRVAPR